MTSTDNMSGVLRQSSAIPEIHNVRKQTLEMSQQSMAQNTEIKKKEAKSKIKRSETKSRIEMKQDQEQKNQKGNQKKKRDPEKEKSQSKSTLPKKKMIDIIV